MHWACVAVDITPHQLLHWPERVVPNANLHPQYALQQIGFVQSKRPRYASLVAFWERLRYLATIRVFRRSAEVRAITRIQAAAGISQIDLRQLKCCDSKRHGRGRKCRWTARESTAREACHWYNIEKTDETSPLS